jgi:hypothetical protein
MPALTPGSLVTCFADQMTRPCLQRFHFFPCQWSFVGIRQFDKNKCHNTFQTYVRTISDEAFTVLTLEKTGIGGAVWQELKSGID